jgi:hypothetical protein
MGHFSFSCKLTGLPITGSDKAALIPLFPKLLFDNSDEHVAKFGTTHFISNDGVRVKFDPAAFPIFGDYSGYGSLENIVEDDNTKALESFFELSIQDIVDVLTSNRKDDWHDDSLKVIGKSSKSVSGRHKLLIKMSGTWMRKEVYDGLAALPSTQYFDRIDMGVPSILRAMGFKLSSTKGPHSRFNELWQQGDVTLYGDGNWVGRTADDHLYNFKDLVKHCKSKGLDLDISELMKKGLFEQIYDYLLPDVKSLGHNDRWTGDRVRHLFNVDRYMASESPDTLAAHYFKLVKQTPGYMRSNMVDFHKVERYWFYLGKFFEPVGTSPQDGEPAEVLKVTKLAMSILNADLVRYGVPDDDEDEEDDY